MSSSTRPSTPASPEGLDLSGQTLAEFHILRKLGQGGMGQVYLAEQLSLKRKVALKILPPDLAALRPEALARFKAEAETVGRATHANILQVYAYGEVEGMPYIALEYIEGRNLKEFVLKKGPPAPLLAVSIMRQVASALQRASEFGIVHRDIKPDNILLSLKYEAKVADFGLARCQAPGETPLNLTASGVTMGTPLYMSPEQAEGRPVDCRTDIYSFGATCYHMLTGRPPFQGSTAMEVALKHLRESPEPLAKNRPDLPEELCRIVHKMMAKKAADRYQTPRDLLRDLARVRDSLGGSREDDPSITASPFTSELKTALADSPTTTHRLRIRRASQIGVFALSVLLVAGAGALVAWKTGLRYVVTGHKDEIARAEADGASHVLPGSNELALRKLVEEALGPPKGPPVNPASGTYKELGVLYLNEYRLDDADKLFDRLAKFQEPRETILLGKLGHAIVLALRNKAHESNNLLREVFRDGKEGEPNRTTLSSILKSPDWQYWIGKANWYNAKNGVSEKQLPDYLKEQFPVDPNAPRDMGKPIKGD